MARDRASIRLDIWADDDFRGLSVGGQHLYLHLLSSPTLSYAGVADWRPARLAGMSKGATASSVRESALELSEGAFVVIDEETEEVLIRSFLKHDGLMHKPNVAKAMVAAYGKTVSPLLRGVIVYELTRLNEKTPELRSFQEREVSELLSKPSRNPFELVSKGLETKGVKGSNPDPSLLTPNSLLLTPDTTHLATSTNAVRDDVMNLCLLLQSLIEGNGSKRPDITEGWLTDARLLIDKDKREPEAAARLMRWCQEDTFWRSNILSMPKFRKRYDQLRLAANDEQAKNASRKRLTPTERATQTLTLATEIDMKGIE